MEQPHPAARHLPALPESTVERGKKMTGFQKHHCWRCGRDFYHGLENPPMCPNCRSPLWSEVDKVPIPIPDPIGKVTRWQCRNRQRTGVACDFKWEVLTSAKKNELPPRCPLCGLYNRVMTALDQPPVDQVEPTAWCPQNDKPRQFEVKENATRR